MKTISPELKQQFVNGDRATIIRITTKSGDVYRWTDYDTEIIVGGFTFQPAPGLFRSNMTSTIDDSVSNQEISSGWLDAPEEDLLAGKFDDALVEVGFIAPTRTDLGVLVIGKGNIGVVQWTADGFRADIQSHMRKLARNINFVVTPNCRHILFSQESPAKIGFCGINKASYTYSGTVAAVEISRLRFSVTGLLQVDGWCQNGTLTFTTGANAGLTYEVKKHTVGGSVVIELFLPATYDIASTDQFEITAGCDRTIATCKNKFNNVVNFGGFPHIQTEVQYR